MFLWCVCCVRRLPFSLPRAGGPALAPPNPSHVGRRPRLRASPPTLPDHTPSVCRWEFPVPFQGPHSLFPVSWWLFVGGVGGVGGVREWCGWRGDMRMKGAVG